MLALVVFSLSLLLAAQGQHVAEVPKPNFAPEKNSNKTIDEIITEALGGVDVAQNMMLSEHGKILAELDMYLSKDQFVSMYEPPSQADMVKMGMMPSIEGTSNEEEPQPFSHSNTENSGRTKRKATRSATYRWTRSEVPYLFAKGHFSKREEYDMRRSMTEWERYTCLKFRPATRDDSNSVRFQNGMGCNSQLGMVGGVQPINLAKPGCRFKGLYLHEIGHAVGLVHEHQLPDRDRYISIIYKNVAPHMRVWFNKYSTLDVDQMAVPYEYSSVMHYGITAFSYNGKAQTIQAWDRSKEESIGKVYLKELAYSDVHIVNNMYNCSRHCTNQDKCGTEGHMDQNCNCICKDGSQDCDRTRQPDDKNCKNLWDSWQCYIWANQGECKRNGKYMNTYCAKACGVCGRKSTEISACKDVHAQAKCRVWKERGDCVTNINWMTDNCKDTCNLCGDIDRRPEVKCTNQEDDAECDGWARKGECVVNHNWMPQSCTKSCAMCGVDVGKTNTTTDGGDEDDMKCEDKNVKCQAWSEANQCEDNPSWMINNCRKACKKCKDGTCKNFYDDTLCEIWAQKRECVSNADWMGTHCAKACGTGLCEGKGTPPTTLRPTAKPTDSSTRGTSTSTGKSATCENKHSSDTQCDIWAKNDHCAINPSWMLKNCKKSCGICGGGEGSGGGGGGSRVTTTRKTSTTDPRTTGTRNECHDENKLCEVWSKHGFCNTNARYNLIYCKKSCKNCNGCRDTEFLCKVWADNGHCTKNANFMLRNCQKSCNACLMTKEAVKYQPTGDGNGTATHKLMTSLWILIVFVTTFLYKM